MGEKTPKNTIFYTLLLVICNADNYKQLEVFWNYGQILIY